MDRPLPDIKRTSPPPPTPTINSDVDPLGAACTTAALAAPPSSPSGQSAGPSDALVAAVGSWTDAARAKYGSEAERAKDGPEAGPDLTAARSQAEQTVMARGQAYGAAINAAYDAWARDAP